MVVFFLSAVHKGKNIDEASSCIGHVCCFGAETREDRTKRLFRHYTVGSYDNFTSYRYCNLLLPYKSSITHVT